MSKSLNDWLDVADQVTGGLETALNQPKPDRDKRVIDVSDDGTADIHWDEPLWADCLGTHHRFGDRESATPVCKLAMRESDIGHRRVLEHGKRIVVCTSCVIGVGK